MYMMLWKDPLGSSKWRGEEGVQTLVTKCCLRGKNPVVGCVFGGTPGFGAVFG